jgi:hypothetical protein
MNFVSVCGSFFGWGYFALFGSHAFLAYRTAKCSIFYSSPTSRLPSAASVDYVAASGLYKMKMLSVQVSFFFISDRVGGDTG